MQKLNRTLTYFLVVGFFFPLCLSADPVTDVTKGGVEIVAGAAQTSVTTVVGAVQTSAEAVGTVTGETLDVAGQSGMSVVHGGVLGTLVRILVIPFEVLQSVLTGSRGLKGLHNVITRPYEGP